MSLKQTDKSWIIRALSTNLDAIGIGIWIAALILFAFIVSGCARIRQNTELYYVKKADQVLIKAVPNEVLTDCGYDFSIKNKIVSVAELGKREEIAGTYATNSKVIYYEKGKYSVIAHERMHALNWEANDGDSAGWRCLDEVSAYLIEKIIRDEEKHAIAIRNLKEKEKARTRGY